MRLFGLFLAACLILVFQCLGSAQTPVGYKGKLLAYDGKQIHAEQVTISLGENAVVINKGDKSHSTISIPFSSITNVEYAYSERPRYTAGALSTAALGWAGLPIFFNQTKKNWLTINADKDSAIIQLLSSDYRMLLLAMQEKGLKISDKGDKDKTDKSRESQSKEQSKH